MGDSDGIELPVRTRACRHGRFTYPTGDLIVGRSLERYGEYAELELGMCLGLLRPGAVVIEAGANIGALTVPLSRAVGDTGKIIAYEPQWVIRELLSRNLAANERANVEVRGAALGAAPGILHAPDPDYSRAGNFGGIALTASHGRPVSVETVDGLGLSRLDLLKLDVEGMECAVLAGAVDTVGRLRPTIYLENDRVDQSPRLIAQLIAAGYRLWWHITPLFNPDNYAREAENVFRGGVFVNMICLPSERPAIVTDQPEVLGPDETWKAALTRRSAT